MLNKFIYRISKLHLKASFSIASNPNDAKIDKNIESNAGHIHKIFIPKEVSKPNFIPPFHKTPSNKTPMQYNKLTDDELTNLIILGNISEYIEIIEFCSNNPCEHKEIIKKIDYQISKSPDLNINISDIFRLLDLFKKCSEGYLIRPTTFHTIVKKLNNSKNWLNNENDVKSMVKTTIFFGYSDFQFLMSLENNLAKHKFCIEMVDLADFINQYYTIKLQIHDIILNHMHENKSLRDADIMTEIRLSLKIFRIFDSLKSDHTNDDLSIMRVAKKYDYLHDEPLNINSNTVEDMAIANDTKILKVYKNNNNIGSKNSQDDKSLEIITSKLNKLLCYLFQKKVHMFKDKMTIHHLVITYFKLNADFIFKYKNLLNIVTYYTDKFILSQLKSVVNVMSYQDSKNFEDIIEFHVNINRVNQINTDIVNNFEDFQIENLVTLLKLYKKFNLDIQSNPEFFENLANSFEKSKQNNAWMNKNHQKLEEFIRCLDLFNVNSHIDTQQHQATKAQFDFI